MRAERTKDVEAAIERKARTGEAVRKVMKDSWEKGRDEQASGGVRSSQESGQGQEGRRGQGW